jgi:hypothetical protein
VGVPAASLSSRNLRLSVQRHLRDAWAAPASLEVGWVEGSFDPDGLGAGASPLDRWAAASWLQDTAGGKGAALLQLDLVSRAPADPLGDVPLRLADLLTAAMRVRSIPLYDFSAVLLETDAEVPVPGNSVLVGQEGGQLGERSDILGPVREGELWRVTVTYRLRLLSDFSSAAYYP